MMTFRWPFTVWLLVVSSLIGISSLTRAVVIESTNGTSVTSSTESSSTTTTLTRDLKHQSTHVPTANDSKVWVIAPIILLVCILAVFLVIYWQKIRRSRKGKDTSTRGDYHEMRGLS